MLKLLKAKNYIWRRYNISLIIVVIILSLISAFTLKLSGGTANGSSNMKHQLAGLLIGLVIILFVSIIDYHFICKFVILYYLIGTVMVAATKFSPLGSDQNTNSYRWLKLPGFYFQPSEICKIIVILVLAVYFTKMKNKLDKFYTLALAALIALLPTAFILVQSDLSSSLVVIFILVMMVFASGIGYKILMPILAVTIPSIIILFWYILQPNQRLLDTYQKNRIVGFLDPANFKDSIMYQQLNSIQSIASGKINGKYLIGGASDIRDYKRVDVTESDFVWSVIGEEFGFLGSCFILLLLATIITKCLLTAKKAMDYLGMLIATGIASMFMFQVFANIGVATCILPNTGLPLPFLSAGLSSMLSSMIAIGIVINIGIYPLKTVHSGFTFK